MLAGAIFSFGWEQITKSILTLKAITVIAEWAYTIAGSPWSAVRLL